MLFMMVLLMLFMMLSLMLLMMLLPLMLFFMLSLMLFMCCWCCSRCCCWCSWCCCCSRWCCSCVVDVVHGVVVDVHDVVVVHHDVVVDIVHHVFVVAVNVVSAAALNRRFPMKDLPSWDGFKLRIKRAKKWWHLEPLAQSYKEFFSVDFSYTRF